MEVEGWWLGYYSRREEAVTLGADSFLADEIAFHGTKTP